MADSETAATAAGHEQGKRPDSPANEWTLRASDRVFVTLGLSPNSLSIIALVISIFAAVCLMQAQGGSKLAGCIWWAGAMASLLLRLFCNRLARKLMEADPTRYPLAGLFTEVPDRIADGVIFMAAGYSNDWVVKVCSTPVGWVAAVLTVITSHIRVLGQALTRAPETAGPMGNTQRLLLLALACPCAAIEQCIRTDNNVEHVMQVTLSIVIVGCVITCFLRMARIAKRL